MGVKLSISSCNLTDVYVNKEKGYTILTLSCGKDGGKFNLNVGALDVSQVPELEKIKVEAEIVGELYGRNQSLKCSKFSFAPVG